MSLVPAAPAASLLPCEDPCNKVGPLTAWGLAGVFHPVAVSGSVAAATTTSAAAAADAPEVLQPGGHGGGVRLRQPSTHSGIVIGGGGSGSGGAPAGRSLGEVLS